MELSADFHGVLTGQRCLLSDSEGENFEFRQHL